MNAWIAMMLPVVMMVGSWATAERAVRRAKARDAARIARTRPGIEGPTRSTSSLDQFSRPRR